jgi:hypothetical protein
MRDMTIAAGVDWWAALVRGEDEAREELREELYQRGYALDEDGNRRRYRFRIDEHLKTVHGKGPAVAAISLHDADHRGGGWDHPSNDLFVAVDEDGDTSNPDETLDS